MPTLSTTPRQRARFGAAFPKASMIVMSHSAPDSRAAITHTARHGRQAALEPWADHVTPNLPSRDFDVTEAFYAKLGFATSWKDRGWMILQRGGLQLEFFPYPDLDPATSSFGCCLRLDDLDAMVALVNAAGAEEKAPAGRASKLRNWRRAA
ncbi:hypothetical protein MS6194_04023 [Escherichia coli]|nr:hypothetical protein [Escherichia coli]